MLALFFIDMQKKRDENFQVFYILIVAPIPREKGGGVGYGEMKKREKKTKSFNIYPQKMNETCGTANKNISTRYHFIIEYCERKIRVRACTEIL